MAGLQGGGGERSGWSHSFALLPLTGNYRILNSIADSTYTSQEHVLYYLKCYFPINPHGLLVACLLVGWLVRHISKKGEKLHSNAPMGAIITSRAILGGKEDCTCQELKQPG